MNQLNEEKSAFAKDDGSMMGANIPIGTHNLTDAVTSHANLGTDNPVTETASAERAADGSNQNNASINVTSLMSTFADRPKNNYLVMAIAFAALAVMAAYFVFGQAYDNDIWFILATGKEIVENGIPYENPFAVHEGLAIVVQQWMVCALYYLIYSATDFLGLAIWVTFIFAIAMFSIYKVARIIRDDKFGGEWILISIVACLYPITAYASMRPHLYTLIAFVWIIGFCELYRRSNKIKWLIPIPFICALHVNFQSAMAPFDLVIIVCYAIPNFLAPLHKKKHIMQINCVQWNYKRLPILIVLIISALALLANPYGLDGALYLVNSFGSASYESYISEMQYLAPAAHIRYANFALVVIVAAILIGRMGLKRINFPFVLLLAGTSVLGFTQTRNLWLAPLFAILYFAWVSRGYSIFGRSKIGTNKPLGAALFAIALIAFCVICYTKVPDYESVPENTDRTPVAAMDYLEEINADKEKVRVMDFFNPGGYIEFRGYKVNMDPRPELWSPGITKQKFDYYKEYVDMHNGKIYFDDYIKKYGFNVFVVPKDDGAIEELKNQEKYKEIDGGDNYRAFILKDAYTEITGSDIRNAPEVHLRGTSKSS